MDRRRRSPWRGGSVALRPATAADAALFAPRLQEDDVAEIRAAVGLDPEPALLRFHAMSDESEVLVQEDGTIVSWWGIIGREGGGVANIWALCGPEVWRNPHSWMRIARDVVRDAADRYGVLYLYVDERNVPMRRWYETVGFEPFRAVPNYGHEGRTFFEYVRAA